MREEKSHIAALKCVSDECLKQLFRKGCNTSKIVY